VILSVTKETKRIFREAPNLFIGVSGRKNDAVVIIMPANKVSVPVFPIRVLFIFMIYKMRAIEINNGVINPIISSLGRLLGGVILRVLKRLPNFGTCGYT